MTPAELEQIPRTLSDAAVDSMLDSLPHLSGGKALLLFAGYELTSRQLIRIAERGDSLVTIKRGRGRQQSRRVTNALNRVDELRECGETAESAFAIAAREFNYDDPETLRRASTRRKRERHKSPICVA